mmetsp:Transcript_26046/g.54973  ORF Transcript_26046/g.54973 Transcript_26046/m.54973 type:complete len:464 (+) Transcript_26046:85-1476(+)
MQYQIIDTSQTGLFPEVQVSHPLEQYNQSHFTPKPYTPTHNVEDQHHFPRFGHTNNFAALASGLAGDSTEGTDYIVGVCAGALLILSVGLVWFMIIVGLNIAGQKKVGFLAGRLEHPDYIASKSSSKNGGSARDVGTLPIIDEEPEEEGMEMEHSLLGDASSPLIISNTLEQDARKEKKFKRKVLAVRAVFVLSGLGVIVSSVLFYSKGVASFKKSLNSVHGGLELVQQTAHAAMGLTNGVLTDSDDLYNDLQYTKTEGQKCQGDGPIASQIRHDLKNFASEAKELGAMLRSTLKAFENDLEELVSITEDVDEKLKAADIFFGFTIAITVFITVLIVAMLVVTYFSARGVNNCCTKITTHAILWPVFIFFLVLAWIFALLFLVVSLAGSDFCIKPDKIVEGALREYQSQFKSAIFEVIIYYISVSDVIMRRQVVGKCFDSDILNMCLPIFISTGVHAESCWRK